MPATDADLLRINVLSAQIASTLDLLDAAASDDVALTGQINEAAEEARDVLNDSDFRLTDPTPLLRVRINALDSALGFLAESIIRESERPDARDLPDDLVLIAEESREILEASWRESNADALLSTAAASTEFDD